MRAIKKKLVDCGLISKPPIELIGAVRRVLVRGSRVVVRTKHLALCLRCSTEPCCYRQTFSSLLPSDGPPNGLNLRVLPLQTLFTVTSKHNI